MKYLVSLLVVLFLLTGNSFAQDKASKDRVEREQMREVGRDHEADASGRGDQGYGTRKKSSGVSSGAGSGYSAGANKGKKSNLPADEQTSRPTEAKTQRGSAGVSTDVGSGYSAGANKGKKSNLPADEQTSRPTEAKTAGSARGGAISSGASSDEGSAVQSSDPNAGLLGNKKKGRATSVSPGKVENKAKKEQAVDDQGSDAGSGGRRNPAGD